MRSANFTDGYDNIIVGGGAAGSVVAARLSENADRRVLLLEAGPADSDPNIPAPHGVFPLLRGPLDWSYTTTPQPHLDGREIPISGGRLLGGGGSINYQSWFRGHRLDYDTWSAHGMKGWSFDEVLPAFKRSEDHELGASHWHGTGGPIPVTTPRDLSPLSLAFIAAGVDQGMSLNRDFTGAELDGVGLMYGNLRDGERVSAARGYLHPAADRPNLEVRTGALVRRVLTESGRAVGVEYTDDSGSPTTVHADSVVLSAGGIRSAQLLMLSGIGPADHLSEHGIDVVADLPGVGSNLQDHLSAMVIWPVTHGTTWLDAYTQENVTRYQRDRRGPLASVGQAAGFLRAGRDAPAPDIQLLPMLIDLSGSGRPGFTCLVTLLTPDSRGTVRLRSADAASNPAVDMRYLESAKDRRTLIDGLRATMALGESPIFRAVTGEPFLPGATDDTALEQAVRASAISINHPAGTCRAGVDEASVVDPDLRVHGVIGLHVVDSSVMPTLPRGNIHAPSIMIGERGAQLIAGA
ncbi:MULTISPECIES: GMC family oxidoreductase [Catenuloplanes]|uniref:Choline dehydrogenase n=1 Tax=Catenuloplanes niger TaxID=587534 RepID=A0AAE3ZW36_9ACTN|nr:GMC family oxidoreductase N-terminal domain-containing protein [Catenuloplanes niger]MDR7327139.1 choline dehydrogenase [Catenuloplanes niger]